jgi:hypothetical protein
MYRFLRNLHLSTALFSLIFLLAYGISAVEFAHEKWIPHPDYRTIETLKLQPGITDARILARQWRGELTSIEAPPGSLKFRVISPLGTGHDVEYSIATGETKVETTTLSLMRTLLWIHISHGIWTAVVALVGIALLTLGLTGLYLWFKNHSERKIGAALLILGAGTAIGLIVSMRQP